VSGYAWLSDITGLFTLGARLQVEPLPSGQVFVAAHGGLEIGGSSITFGVGEPGETSLDVLTASAVIAWLDGTDGMLQEARLLSTTTGSVQSSALHMDMDVAINGDIVLTGYWSGQNRFHPNTAYQTVMATPYALNGNTLDRAEDPYYTRMDSTGVVQWLRRGYTPTPLLTTWTNWPQGIAALPNGDSFLAGWASYANFVIGYGTSGAVTTPYEIQYLTRLDDQGVPLWVGLCTGFLNYKTLKASPSGELYVMMYEDSTLFVNTPDELSIPLELDDDDNSTMRALIRLDPDGGALWVRRLVSIGQEFTPAVAVRDDGSVVISAVADAEFQLRDEMGTAASVVTDGTQRVLASLSADGEVQWMLSTGLGISSYSHWAMETVGGDVWVALRLPGDATEIAIADQVLPLPQLQFDPALYLSLLARFDASGAVAEVRVVGAGMQIIDLSSDGASMLIAGGYHCGFNEPQPWVFDDQGVAVMLPSACDQVDDDAMRGFVMSMPL
jgi:hypothetical protein